MFSRKTVGSFAICLSGTFSSFLMAAEKDPPKEYFEEPASGSIRSTTFVPGSIVQSGDVVIFDSVDGSGKVYTAEFDMRTATLTAVSGNGMIRRTFSGPEVAAMEAIGTQVATPAVALIPLVPLAIAAMCYANDQFTKHDMITSCRNAGQTVVMKNTGICGFNAEYDCRAIPPPPVPTPAPTPVPGPTPSYSGIWLDGGSGYIAVGASDYWSVWTYDDDWF